LSIYQVALLHNRRRKAYTLDTRANLACINHRQLIPEIPPLISCL